MEQIYIILIIIVICCFCVSSSISMSGGLWYLGGGDPKKPEAEPEESEKVAKVQNSVQTPVVQQTSQPSVPVVQTSASVVQTSAPVVQTPAPAPGVEPFVLNNKLNNTGYNQIGNYAMFLDRHWVNCDKEGALNEFQLDTLLGTMRYNYKCTNNANLEDSVAKNNNPSEANTEVYLDRQPVDCGTDSVISEFRLNNNNWSWQYMYKCKKAKNPLKCRDVRSNVIKWGSAGNTYADNLKQLVKCEKDEAISRFGLHNYTEGGGPVYNYRCCKY